MININYLPTLNKLKIDNKTITIFASGSSILDIQDDILEDIFDNTFVITMNYGFEYFLNKNLTPNLNIHSDIRVSEYIYKYFVKANIEVPFKILSKNEAFNIRTKHCVDIIDYHFKTNQYGRSHYTLAWLMGILKNIFKDKQVLLFGHDCYVKDFDKFYDSYTDFDFEKRGGKNYNVLYKTIQCDKQLEQYKKYNVINCNTESKSKVFKKQKYIIKENK